MNRWRKALALAVVPGLGHLYLGRHWRGVLVFAVFAMAVNGMYFHLAAGESAGGEPILRFFAGACAAIWAYSVLHVAYLSRRFETKRFVERKDYHFKRGLTQYLGGLLEPARGEFLAVLKLDPMDIDARFHLGMTYLGLGERKKGVRSFKRCLTDDIDAKWKWEIETELEKMKKAR